MLIDPFFWTQPQPRIVQYQKRRFALRLESIFWLELEKAARRRGVRLGRIVAELDKINDGPNLSSFIRGFCMVEAERETAKARLGAGAYDLLDVLRGCPAPALLLNQERQILEFNQALLDWTGQKIEADGSHVLHQQKFDAVFEPRIGKPLDQTVEAMRSGQLKRAQFPVAYKGTGDAARIVTATLTGLPVGSLFYVLVWLTVGVSNRLTVR
ncbi:MAG: hypothetical protein JWM96_557 [Alphaproteobacteria bacterium]|nr:hypothetical protein [Alphaproteobacteria bacterium]